MAKQEKTANISMVNGDLTVPGEYVERLIDLLENGLERQQMRNDKEIAMRERKEGWLDERKEFIKSECAKIEDRMKKLDVLSEEYSELAKVYSKLINIDKTYLW